jgi:2-polyprenyl-3-methyl-5-hydroxy-6-metoxy-1,4-benzoquinol methylase
MTWSYYADPRADIQKLVQPRDRRILDVGCGEGALAAALKQSGADHVAGIEASPDAARHARGQLDVLVEGDVLQADLPFRDGEFDYLVFADVLEHLAEPERALERLLPFLREDGRVIVSVPNMRFYWVLLRLVVDRWAYVDAGVRDRTHLRVVTRHSLVLMLAKQGLTVERLERNYRLLEDQSHIGRAGALATRIASKTIAPWVFPDLLAYQYIAVARRI